VRATAPFFLRKTMKGNQTMTDISAIKTSERVVEMLHPAHDTPVGVRVTLVSLDDPKLKTVRRQIQDRRLKLEARGKNFTQAEIDANISELTFAAMTGWEWYKPEGAKEEATFKGETPAFSRAKVFEVFEELPWFREQLVRETGDTKSFFAS
jgi:hypothetical protein